MKSDYFLKKIKFNIFLSGFNYDTGYRKAEIIPCQEKTGVIIGKVIRYEGNYHPSTKGSLYGGYTGDDYGEQGWLSERKGIWFWVVATKMNLTFLVPVKQGEIIEEVSNEKT